MIYRFTFISDEVVHFLREIKINSDDTFLSLHKAILASVGYPDDQMTSFFICNEDWEKECEITLEDMGGSSDVDNYVMEDTRLEELIDEEKQRMLYVFDPLSDRVFFIELSEIIPGKSVDEPICSRKEGDAPKQTLDYDQLLNFGSSSSIDLDDSFDDNENIDIEELDEEGMGFLEDISSDDII